ncbi:hypothetical protein DBV15_08935 [Temnothorax longispinosus]|uniref:Uncharacterized protein n=1 Tax=Temnothorax longispinosus TaxID=300112 RepID=A0A4S2JE26_9HYME|nr:hypothetical protein DBV15_08935 [Temnothorax longispinosus]
MDVFCSRRRSTFHDKRAGTTTTTTTTSSSSPKTAAPVSHPLPAGMEDKGALKNGKIEFKSEHRENENIPGSKAIVTFIVSSIGSHAGRKKNFRFVVMPVVCAPVIKFAVAPGPSAGQSSLQNSNLITPAFESGTKDGGEK